MAKYNFLTVVSIDPAESAVHFYSMTAGDKNTVSHDVKRYRGKLFEKDFYDNFGSLLEEYGVSYPSAHAAAVTIVLPDTAVSTDIVTVPSLRRGKSEEALTNALEGLYRNKNELRFNYNVINSNKQFTTYSTLAIKTSILTKLNAACASNKFNAATVTFRANALVNAAMHMDSKLRSGSYMLMDIKADTTEIAIVSKGRTAGFYSLPFGTNILKKSSVSAEDMLFNRSYAELIVLNARERAKAKQLSMMSSDNSTQVASEMISDEEDEDMLVEESPVSLQSSEVFEDEDEDEIFNETQSNEPVIKTMPKRQPRHLPKFMQRPVPHSAEEYVNENFRIFTKWALNLISANDKACETVYVNIPDGYNCVFESLKDEESENGIPFVRLDTHDENDIISRNLELYGGFFTSSYNKQNNF